jgi:hypothetical protein
VIPAAIKRRALLAASRLLAAAAARCFELATREVRRRLGEVERIIADGTAALAEFVNPPTCSGSWRPS